MAKRRPPCVCVMVMVVVHRLHHIHEHHKWSAQIENQEHVILEYTSGTQFCTDKSNLCRL